jgi:hypothetical protein
MRRPAYVLLLVLAALAAAPASAQVPGDAVRVDPAVAGKASHVILDLRFSEDPKSQGRTPQSGSTAFAAGAKFDPRARAERCSEAKAKAFDCPGNSKIGTGTTNLTLRSNNGVFADQQLVADAQFFLAAPFESGDVAGVYATVKERSTGQQAYIGGRIVKAGAPFGLAVRFDDLQSSTQQAPEGFTLRVDRIQADVGAFRYEKVTVCCKTVTKNGVKRKVKYKKKVRRDLIKNPRTCGGSWVYQVRVRYSASDESVRDGSGACTASRR